jgi:hypothetical protein
MIKTFTNLFDVFFGKLSPCRSMKDLEDLLRLFDVVDVNVAEDDNASRGTDVRRFISTEHWLPGII